MLGDIVLVRQERPDASELQDALASIHDSQLIAAHQFFPKLLVVGSIARTIAPGVGGVNGINGFLAQSLCQFFQCGRLRSSQEDLGVHVADDGVCIVLVDSLQLGSGLQYQTGGDLTAADRCYQLFQVRDLANVRRLIDQAPDMDWESAAIHVICFLTQQVEKLGIDHGD